MPPEPAVVVHVTGAMDGGRGTRRAREVRHRIEATGLILRDDEVLFMLDDQIVARWPSSEVTRVEWSGQTGERAYTLADKRRENPQAYVRWTEDEEARLRQAHEAGVPVGELARRHERNEGAIRSRLQRLGLDPQS
jgi:DNA-directed RNA polymerase specialized sigma24 family protein